MISENMAYRRLAGTEMDVSVVSLGSIGFMRGGCSPEQIAAIAHRALDAGVNFIDTAYAYARGDVETALGPVLEKRRDECFVLTRSHMREPDEFRQTVAGSFERLRTDHIDILELHDVSTAAQYEQVMTNGVYEILCEHVAAGRIGHAGISTHGPLELMKQIVTGGKFDVITVGYNVAGAKRQLADGEFPRDTAEHVLPLAAGRGMGITIMKAFGGGALMRPAPDGTRLDPVGCLLWCLANPHVATVSPGVDSLAELEQDLLAGRPGAALTDEQTAELERLAAQWGKYFCRQCGYCLPCSEDIEIPQVMGMLESWRAAEGDADAQAKLKQRCDGLATKASACVECGECQDRCPYDLPIIERMAEAAAALE